MHLPAYLIDRGLSADVGGWTIAVDRAFQHRRLVRWPAGSRPDAEALSAVLIYSRAALAILAFILLPASPVSALVFGAVIGLLWLSTVPPTYGLVALMFGTRWLTMLAASPSSATRSAASSASGSAACCSSAPAPMTSSGGSRLRLASSRR